MVEALASARIPCWLDEQQLDSGVALRAGLLSAIAQSDVYLYLVSEAANESKWVQDELQYALGRELEGTLKIVPIRLADGGDPLPILLSGRLYSSLESDAGGAARLAHNLAAVVGYDRIPQKCRLSATARLEANRLAHTLAQARGWVADDQHEIGVLLLNNDYETLDGLYWSVAQVRFPAGGSPQDLTEANQFVTDLHDQSRGIITEARLICRRFVATESTGHSRTYYDAGHERTLRVLLHRLQWNVRYLQHIERGEALSDSFATERRLPEPFDGPRCDFVSGGTSIGSVIVPKYGHPWPETIERITPWGLTSPFADIPESEVGIAIGDLLALRFIAGSLSSTEMPSPDSLTYGLS